MSARRDNQPPSSPGRVLQQRLEEPAAEPTPAKPAPTESTAPESTAAKPAPVTPDATFADLMGKLRAAVAANPDDQQGLTLLAENEAKLGNYIASRTAYEHLVALKADAATSNDHAGLAQTAGAAILRAP